jgi:hypothetical protein
MREIEHTIFNPAGLNPIALLPKPRIDASLALLSLRNEGILLTFRLCLAYGAALIQAGDLSFILVAEIVPTRFVAGHHLGHHVLFEHVAVCQYVR